MEKTGMLQSVGSQLDTTEKLNNNDKMLFCIRLRPSLSALEIYEPIRLIEFLLKWRKH